VVGAGLLGLFPCYYSFTQEMPKETMGRMTGLLSFIGWMASAPMQSLFGAIVDKYKSYDLVLGIVGWVPFIGLVLFLCIWPRSNNEPEAE
jgi:MFS transporter, ACS family, hexuronate transporter